MKGLTRPQPLLSRVAETLHFVQGDKAFSLFYVVDKAYFVIIRPPLTEAAHGLPPAERLRLASLILYDLTQSNMSVVDVNDGWNEQDQSDLTAFSLQYAATLYPEDEELVQSSIAHFTDFEDAR